MDRSAKHPVQSFAEQRAALGTAAVAGLNCTRCGCLTMVTNTVRLLGAVRRYRQCCNPECKIRFVTTERARNTGSNSQSNSDEK